MKFTVTQLKEQARELRAAAAARGENLRQQRALNLVAKQHKFGKWEEALAAARKDEASPIADSPFFGSLRRGTVNALWAPGVVNVPCFWSEKQGFGGKPDPLFEFHRVEKLATDFPDKLSLRMLSQIFVQHDDENRLAFGPTHVFPLRLPYEGRILVLYQLYQGQWSDIRATGSAAEALTRKAQEYVQRYPAAASRFPSLSL